MEGSSKRLIKATDSNNTGTDLAITPKARTMSTGLHTDLTVQVDDVVFNLNRFPLKSRSGRLNKLQSAREESSREEIKLVGFPGGADAFEVAVKFCYDCFPIEINPSNVGALRCAAEYLEMTESIEEGNLISRTEEFLTFVLSISWIDSIAILQSCSGLEPWAENLNIVQRCIDSIAEKATANVAEIAWPFTRSSLRKQFPWLYPSFLTRRRSIYAESKEDSTKANENREKNTPHSLDCQLWSQNFGKLSASKKKQRSFPSGEKRGSKLS